MQPVTDVPIAVPTYADRPVTKVPNWHGLVTLDVLFNNLTTGLFICSALAELLAPADFGQVVQLAYPLALLLLIADLVCLVLDLGDPWRFHHMLRVWKPNSPMSLGTWCLSAYAVPLTVLATLSLFPDLSAGHQRLRVAILVVGLVPALGAALYKGVLFSTTSQPGWRDARWLGGYLVNSALTLGAAELLMMAVVAGQGGAIAMLRRALLLLLAFNLMALVALVLDLRSVLPRSRGVVMLLGLGVLSILGGLVLPFLLLLSQGSIRLMVAGSSIIVAAALIRAELVTLPHRLERTERAGQAGATVDLRIVQN